jgi:hypothetical protein
MSYIGTFVTRKTNNSITADRKTKPQPQNEWIKHRFHHAPIIDDITFYSVQRMLSESKQRSTITQQKQSTDFFGGKLYCGICGRKMRWKKSGNGNTYYICPRRDESSSSCTNKSKSEAKIKKQVYSILTEGIKELEDCYHSTLDYERSPYFLRKANQQDTLLTECSNELERQRQLFITLYEGYIISNQIHKTDIQELLRYLARVRSALERKISVLTKAMTNYQEMESSTSKEFQFYQRFCDCYELTEEMFHAMTERVFINYDSVQVEMVKLKSE